MQRADEAMARKLRAAGWRVEPPLTHDNCAHPHATGSGGLSAAGGHYTWTCRTCGKTERREWRSPSRPDLIPSRWS